MKSHMNSNFYVLFGWEKTSDKHIKVTPQNCKYHFTQLSTHYTPQQVLFIYMFCFVFCHLHNSLLDISVCRYWPAGRWICVCVHWCVPVLKLFLRSGKNALTSDLKLWNYVVCPVEGALVLLNYISLIHFDIFLMSESALKSHISQGLIFTSVHPPESAATSFLLSYGPIISAISELRME